MQLSQSRNIRFITALSFTAIILLYLLIRAFNTEFISDETAAYWYYVYRGWFWGDQVVWDAANHPLNSFIGYHLYNQVGDVPGILRMGSIVSFLLYAFAIYQFTGLLNRKRLQIFAFIALLSIPYMLEYFAYLRGYGLSMGFYMCSLWFLYRYANTFKLLHLVLTYVFSFIALSANLTLLNSLILIISAVGLIHLSHFKTLKWWQHAAFIFGTLILARITWPLIAFALKLKASGALYYSSLDGIWDMTGKSLSKYIFFTDNDLLMFGFLLVFILVLFQLWKAFSNNGWKSFLKMSNTWIAYLFFGNLVAVLLMAFLMKVNYPEDRTGMYFVPLFFLLVFHLMQKVKQSDWLLLAFPISLVLHLSIHSSVFTPEERLTTAFYQNVKAKLEPGDVVSIYKTMFANWHYQESHQNKMVHFPHTSMRQGNEADVFLTRGEVQKIDTLRNPWINDYVLIAHEPNSDHFAYKRKYKRKEQLLFQKDSSLLQGNGEFLELLNQPAIFSKAGSDVKLKFQFFLRIDEIRQSTDFVVVTLDEKGQIVRYLPMALELNYQSKALSKQFDFSVMLDNLTPDEKGIKVYLWSRKIGVQHLVKQLHIKVVEEGEKMKKQ
ncbi:MAG: hypothetical protein IT221_15625 [Fluviicola sp.]|nr:hypothetical protein [Fluviicola sp.]